jgi:glycosyltransferase involved in cell wall biosynthesis
MNKSLSIVIPVRVGGSVETTLRSLTGQTFQDFDIIISQDERSSASWARNRGFEFVKTEYVLFSDDDIEWLPNGLESLMTAIKLNPQAAYAYGSYQMGGRLYCDQVFDPVILHQRNYISTMSVIRSAEFPGFDESLDRLQDYELWLRMLTGGRTGVYCGRLIFKTERRSGITYDGCTSYETAFQRVHEKLGV